MHAAALRAELRIPNVASLKQKRTRLKRLIADLRRDFPAVAIAEVDHQDQWQRSALGVAAVAPQAGHLQRLLHTVEERLRHHPDFELLSVSLSHLEERE